MLVLVVMGSGGSKNNNLDVGYNAERRPSQHELTNPPTESRGDQVLVDMCVDITLPCPRPGPLQDMHQEVCIRPYRKAQGRFDRY